ncbi:hypothetical protein Bca4012_035961 [Brassica carinata]
MFVNLVVQVLSTRYVSSFIRSEFHQALILITRAVLVAVMTLLKQLIDISRSQGRLQPPGASSNNFRGNNIRQNNVCIHCQQGGHTSANCPSRVSGSRNPRPTDKTRETISFQEYRELMTTTIVNDHYATFKNISNGTGNETSGRGRRGGTIVAVEIEAAKAVEDVAEVGDNACHSRNFSCGDPSHFANACHSRNSNGNF